MITNIDNKELLASFRALSKHKSCLSFVLQGPVREISAEGLIGQLIPTVSNKRKTDTLKDNLHIGSLIQLGKLGSGGCKYCGFYSYLKDRDNIDTFNPF